MNGELLPIFLGALLTLIAAWSLGKILLRTLQVRLCRLEEDFDSAIPVDQVLVLGARGRGGIKLRIDGLGNDGQWRMLAADPSMSLHLAPEGLRRVAVEELRSLGFEYVVARNDQAPGQDMLRYASYWGMTCFKEIGNVCIFRLD